MESADRVCQLAVAAADEAVFAADLRGEKCRPAIPARTAVSFGTSKGGIATFQALADQARRQPPVDPITSSGQRREVHTSRQSHLCSPLPAGLYELIRGTQNYFCIPPEVVCKHLNPPDGGFRHYGSPADIPPDSAARHLARRLHAEAAVHCTVAACSTGTLAVIRAAQMLADGDADIVIAGGSDASVLPLWVAAFRRMGVLGGAHPARGPAWACRPFDLNRDGFVIAEGAAALVLESGQSVGRRGVTPLARLAGYAMGTDPAGLARLREDGAPLAEIIKIALTRAGVGPHGLSAVQAHGTGTLANDRTECHAILRACGPRAAEIPVSSIKGALGHTLGAAGAIELAMTVEAVRSRTLPPNATLVEPDPSLGLSNLPTRAIPLNGEAILKTSLGFGGHVAAVVVAQA
jgi:3-oxoacyl-(acyl-carrier-protein) synthase